MKNLVSLIKEQKFVEAENEINSIIPLIMEKKIFEMKKACAAKMDECDWSMESSTEKNRKTGVIEEDELDEEEQLDEARVNIIKARIRGGKIQRRKKVSNVPGMTLRGGTLKRMSAAERRRRKMGARKGKMKRKAKMSRTLMKRKRSLQKRKSLGL
jgi:hypothetical protein